MRLGSILLLSAACLFAGCRGALPTPIDAPPHHPSGPPPAMTSITASATLDEPPMPRWVYHPGSVQAADGVELTDGDWLLVGPQGERWIAHREDGRLVADAVAELAPVGLRHVAKKRDGGFRFLGENGEVFDARAADAPLNLVTAPPRPLQAFAGRGAALVGADALGALMRFDGARWVEVSVDAPVFQLVEGRAGFLGLSYPERLLVGDEGGVHWRALDVPPFGAFELMERRDGGVDIAAVSGPHRWSADGRLEPNSKMDGVATEGWRFVTPRPGPSATALADGRASLVHSGFTELLWREEGAEPTYTLREGQLGQRLVERTLTSPLRHACRPHRFAAHDRHFALACREGARLSLLVSYDRGRAWHSSPPLALEPDGEVEVAVGRSGAVLILGEVPCGRDRCPELLRWAPGSKELERIRSNVWAPREVGDRYGLVVGWLDWSGPRPTLVASTAKQGLQPFVSDDDGRTFRALPLQGRSERGESFLRDFTDPAVPGARRVREAADGSLALALDGRNGRGARLLADGTVASVIDARRHGEVVAVAGRGLRWLVALRAGTGAIELWQSLDGGASLEWLPHPIPLRALREEAIPLECSDAGCLVGSELVRVGWGTEPRPSVPPSDTATGVAPERKSRTSIVCRANPSDTIRLHNVEEGALPTAEDAFRGRTSWSVLVREPDGASAVVSATRERSQDWTRLRRELLFPPRGPSRTAERIDAQAEGWIGVRAQGAKEGGIRYDVAWVDRFVERRARGTIRSPDDRPDVFGAGPRPFLHGVDASITAHGAALRVAGGREVYAFDERGHATGPVSFEPWSDVALDRVESLVDDGQPNAVAIHGDGGSLARTVSLASAAPGERLDVAIAPPSGSRREVTTHWSRTGERAGIVVHLLLRDRSRGVGYFAPVRLEGGAPRPIAVPTQHELLEPYRECTNQDVESTPRVIAPFLVGTRHPVTIEGHGEPLMTAEAILHGTHDSPCLLGWTAEASRPGGVRVFLPAALGPSWLLRASRNERLGVEAVPMQCAFAPGQPPPEWTDNFAATEIRR
jgi:hypothetical protein